LVVIFLAHGLATDASADLVEVQFSYVFQDQTTLTGTVNGDLQADGDLVRMLTNLNATYSGQPGTTFSFGLSPFVDSLSLSGTETFQFFGFASDPQTASPMPNFGFSLTNQDFTNAATVGTFSTSSTSLSFPNPGYGEAVESEGFQLASFQASLVPSVVPEPSSWIMTATAALIGLGLQIGKLRRSIVA
jgi:hypothetical protein